MTNLNPRVRAFVDWLDTIPPSPPYHQHPEFTRFADLTDAEMIIAKDYLRSSASTMLAEANALQHQGRPIAADITPQPIETAPEGDGWVLGLTDQDGHPSSKRQPWAIVTRCDGGWTDDDGNYRLPRLWMPLPDPQPDPTGWRPAEGAVHIEHATWRDDKGVIVSGANFSIYILRADGSYDDYRGTDIGSTIDDARQRAGRLAESLGLPIVEHAAPAVRLVHSAPHETPQ